MIRFYVLVLGLLAIVPARVLIVPDSFPTIQQGIDATNNGDTVLVGVNRYYEQIDFHGHNIVVASQFLLDSQLVWVAKTVIDGSRPANPDTASCVRIVSGEDSTAQLVGFTIAYGTGTKWQDEHGAGLFREGGGILVQGSSPVIRDNRIEWCEATNAAGCVSSGGGAIRVGDGSPTIVRNIISNNRGRYGAGLVFNYSGGLLRNNLIAYNSGGQDYGGGGLWSYGDGPTPLVIENCAFYGNIGTTQGGGMKIGGSGTLVRNCIVRGNQATVGPQIHPWFGSNPDVTYSDIEGGRTGTGNIDADPNWVTSDLMLHEPSPCIDSGNPDTVYYDPDSAGVARYPSLGTLRNDMGAYGGPMARNLGAGMAGIMDEFSAAPAARFRVWPQPAGDQLHVAANGGRASVDIADVSGRVRLTASLRAEGEVDVRTLPPGVYLCRVRGAQGSGSVPLVIAR